ncbi:MAG: Asp-tRNA(Asn)/Glu-tRNA(Gln) amidotransferase subunit GatB [Candidatus Nanohaloarchaeota archaeon QJJ-5]|nr:Asp-tRNA(Asn)/Glu-tRNA(Gln) amidotransferase subunit GatB [Candidatus Nanohaloarchaeota archaeon QJJ-5]
MPDDVTIGLETHIQLDTDSKLFCGCPASLSEEPNTHTCPTCLGMPGSKPRTNAAVIEHAVRAALALNCDLNDTIRFSRKTYFYPDMAKNFQITQYEIPVGEDGAITTRLRGQEQTIRIKRLHIEEDPARIVHKGGDIDSSAYTLVDYDRAGIPLLEIVTKPDFSSPAEARAFLQKLTRIMSYLGIYDPRSDLSIKSDANISLEGGERVEVKNITGTKGIENALNYEITRQRNLRKRGQSIERQTRSYSSAQQITTALRSKEAEEEYGYIFEPDLTEVVIDAELRHDAQKNIPELPDEKRRRFQEEYDITAEMVDALITSPAIADVFETLSDEFDDHMIGSFLTKELKKTLNYNEMSFADAAVDHDDLRVLFSYLADDKLTDRNAEELIREMVATGTDPATIIEEDDLLKDEEGLAEYVSSVIEEEQEAVEDYQTGDDDAINYLVGQIMQRSGGKVDPREAREQLEAELD